MNLSKDQAKRINNSYGKGKEVIKEAYPLPDCPLIDNPEEIVYKCNNIECNKYPCKEVNE